RQRPGESLDDFFKAVRRLVAAVTTEVDQEWVIKTTKRNLAEPMKSWVYPVRVYTLEHLYEECREAERAFDPEHGRTRSRIPIGLKPRTEARGPRVEEVRPQFSRNEELEVPRQLEAAELYLGVDFWQKFQLALDIVAVAELDPQGPIVDNQDGKQAPEPHKLSEAQQKDLDEVVESFLTYERNGLGRTKVMRHSIELVAGAVPVKDRHYPLRYLGFIIGKGVLRTDPAKVEAIRNMVVPRSAKEVRRFLGTAGWYKRFIRNFAEVAPPLTDTLRKGNKFQMSQEAKEAFN
ncbi:hypothetical protein KR018_005951, partial [Drosophila ironensis]